jgi:polysaccharide pyruvyl transferase WcaK-like protein
MITVVTCGANLQYNFGCPSIMHGFYELLNEVFGNNFRLINLHIGNVIDKHLSDMNYNIVPLKSYTPKNFYIQLLCDKLRVGKENEIQKAFDIVKHSDVVVEVFGISFCDSLNDRKLLTPLIPLYWIKRFPFNYYAMKHGIYSIKNTSSFGPAQSKFNVVGAHYSVSKIFNKLVAREVQSVEALRKVGIQNDISVAPDVANLMKYKKRKLSDKSVIGISTSHQIIRQWKSEESYIDCICNLCLHIKASIDAEIILIPNEFSPRYFNDIDVSKKIRDRLTNGNNIDIDILDVMNMTSSDLKNTIASCDALIASRYHSCVAALSSGVPVIVIGWHYKYAELMSLYGQEKWHLSEDDCNSSMLIEMFDELWISREELHNEITFHYKDVRSTIIENGKKMLKGITPD